MKSQKNLLPIFTHLYIVGTASYAGLVFWDAFAHSYGLALFRPDILWPEMISLLIVVPTIYFIATDAPWSLWFLVIYSVMPRNGLLDSKSSMMYTIAQITIGLLLCLALLRQKRVSRID